MRVLLDAGADPSVPDQLVETALVRVRKHLGRYEDRPRTPSRKPNSHTPGGELILPDREWKFIETMEAEHKGLEDLCLDTRRKAAAKIRDPRSQLELAVALLASQGIR